MDIGFRLVKMADISLITVIYFAVGFFAARGIDNISYSFNEEDDVVLWKVCIDLIFYLIITSISIYLLRNLIHIIPSPFEGLYKFQHLRVKELQSAQILTFSILYYQKNLQDKLKYLYNKL